MTLEALYMTDDTCAILMLVCLFAGYVIRMWTE
jgi:hypothetical protein